MTFNQLSALVLAFAAASQLSAAADEQKSAGAISTIPTIPTIPTVAETRDSRLGEPATLAKLASTSRPAQTAWR